MGPLFPSHLYSQAKGALVSQLAPSASGLFQPCDSLCWTQKSLNHISSFWRPVGTTSLLEPSDNHASLSVQAARLVHRTAFGLTRPVHMRSCTLLVYSAD